MVSLMDASLYTAALSAALLLGLILTYAKVYRDTRAQFSLGLTIFAAILFAQNILAVYSFVTMSPFIGEPFLPYLLGMNIAQVLGILVLFRTTLRSNRPRSRPDVHHISPISQIDSDRQRGNNSESGRWNKE